jgi:hypothetical protein
LTLAAPNCVVAIRSITLARRAGERSDRRVVCRSTFGGHGHHGCAQTFAVLDDDQDLTNRLCTHLESSGYNASPFHKISRLLARAARNGAVDEIASPRWGSGMT